MSPKGARFDNLGRSLGHANPPMRGALKGRNSVINTSSVLVSESRPVGAQV